MSVKPFKGKTDIISKKIDELITIGRKEWADEAFDAAGNLKPNKVYVSGKPGTDIKYIYGTDSKGRITEAYARPLRLWKGKRPRHDSKTPDKLPGDHAGHLFANIFGGSDKLDNLVSQSSTVNLSDMRKLERKWQTALKEGKEVNVDVKIMYGRDGRPTGFRVTDWVDGKKHVTKFAN